MLIIKYMSAADAMILAAKPFNYHSHKASRCIYNYFLDQSLNIFRRLF